MIIHHYSTYFHIAYVSIKKPMKDHAEFISWLYLPIRFPFETVKCYYQWYRIETFIPRIKNDISPFCKEMMKHNLVSSYSKLNFEDMFVIKGTSLVNAISARPSSNTQNEILQHFFRTSLVSRKGVGVV